MTSDIQPIDMVKQENPLLIRLSKLPGSTIRLPSKGIFYKNGELDPEVIDGEVVVFQMTATDDIMLKSPDMLYQGTAIESVIRRCIPQIKKPMDLLIGDVDYILTQMRRLSYGSHIPMEYSCSCVKDADEAKRRRASGDDTHMIPLDTFIQSSKELSVNDFNKKYKLTTGSGQTVVLRPIRYGDFVKIQQMNDADKLVNAEEIEAFLATNCTAFTQSVDGIDDSELIFEWYLKLPRSDYELIKKKLNNVGEWGISFKYTVTCKFCNKSEELTTQLNPLYFFMLPSSQETNTK
jgi:hypothetical protein